MNDRTAHSTAAPASARSHASPETAIVTAAALTRYPGGKNGAGVWQRLISLMPPHKVYIEAFLGSGAILRRKRPAEGANIGIDIDAAVIAAHNAGGREECNFICADALEWLGQSRIREFGSTHTLIYCDPPYLGAARARAQRPLYRHELMSAERHEQLLQILTTLPSMVMINGYASELYEHWLRGWRRIEYPAMTRGGMRPEIVWFNYPMPRELHDYRFLGDDFHDRCRITRKIKRWTRRLASLPDLERAAVLAALDAERNAPR